MALNPGDTLSNGHYRIIRQLGRGGFGFVYLAEDTLLAEEVAIKELIPALVGDEIMLKRFLAEARATMRLRHRRIVGTHNVFEEGGNYYIVMEYMPGGSLEECLRERSLLPVSQAVRVVAQVCEGLAFAHEEGVVHCDLKPANILFAADGTARVADFGIAHVSGEMLTRTWMTPAGFVAGTLPYMSPEQADGVRDNPRVDVYALGAVLYRMLTGRLYLEFDQHETPGATADNVYRIRNERPAPPSTHNPHVPPWLSDVVLRAMAKQPEDRYNSMDELRAALVRQRVEPVQLPASSRPVSPARAIPYTSRTRPRRAPLPVWFWPAAAGAVVLMVLLVIALRAALGGGAGTETAMPQPTRTLVAAATSGLVLAPTRTPLPTSTPKEVDTPHPTAPATDTSRLTDTSGPPAATDTPQATATLAPTATLTRKAAQAVATRIWEKDGSVMVYVPAGTFWMGSGESDEDAGDDERPQHEVYLDAFWIDRTEVTNSQYRRCVNDGGCRWSASNSRSATRDSYYGATEFDDYPVIKMTWDQAEAYCTWVGKRLPTEAEWEKAARGTDKRTFPWGEAIDCSHANFSGCVGDTAKVGSYPSGASPYGVLNMAGNVWEWVADWYAKDYYANSPERNPLGPDSGEDRVLRGGSWYHAWTDSRAANRRGYSPTLGSDSRGFRCALSAPEP